MSIFMWISGRHLGANDNYGSVWHALREAMHRHLTTEAK